MFASKYCPAGKARYIYEKWERGLLALRTTLPSVLQSAASAIGHFISIRNDMTFSDI